MEEIAKQMFSNFMDINRYLLAQMRRIYFMALPESKQDFKKSRVYFTVGDSAAQTIVQLSGGTFLATLMAYCGISDANIGIITSLVSLAAISQIFLIQYMKRIKKYKFLVCATAMHRVLFTLIYFIPLLSIRNSEKAVFIIILYFIGQIFVQIGTPAAQDWIASLVPSRLRGKYFSIKDSIAVFIVSSTMLLAGMILDYFKTRNIMTGFIIIGILIFILVVINVVALSKMKEPKISYMNQDGKEMHGRLAKKAKEIEVEQKDKGQGILLEIKEAFTDRKFRKAFTLQFLYTFAFYICTPFYASYQINELKLPYTFIMLVGFIANLYRIYITPKFGRLADKYGMAKILRYSLLALGLNLFFMAITVPGNAYPMHIVGTIFSSTAWAFVGIGLFGVQLDFFKNEKRMIWLTFVSSISGVFGFFVSIIGGKMLDYLQKSSLSIGGVTIYAQQVLNMIGFIIMLITVLYIKFFIETEKIKANHSDGRVKL
jgi:MFS family permease